MRKLRVRINTQIHPTIKSVLLMPVCPSDKREWVPHAPDGPHFQHGPSSRHPGHFRKSKGIEKGVGRACLPQHLLLLSPGLRQPPSGIAVARKDMSQVTCSKCFGWWKRKHRSFPHNPLKHPEFNGMYPRHKYQLVPKFGVTF